MADSLTEDVYIETGDSDFGSRLALDLAKSNCFCIWGGVNEILMEHATSFLMSRVLRGEKLVTLLICSPGGDGDSARGLVGVMELAKAQGMIIRTVAFGQACSAAFDILVAGTSGQRYCSDTCLLMTHSTSADVRERTLVDLLEKVDDLTYSRYTSLDRKKVKTFTQNGGNYWIAAADAVKDGVVDVVIGPGDKLPEDFGNVDQKI